MSDGMRDTYAGRRDHQPDAEAECTDLRARLAAAEAEVARFRRLIDRLPPYDETGFYISHGEWGNEAVSVKDVMDSLRAALAAPTTEATDG